MAAICPHFLYTVIVKSRIAPFLAAVLAASAVFTAVVFFDRYERELHQQEIRAEALAALSNVKSHLEFTLSSRLMPFEGLSVYISANPGITRGEFNQFAKLIMERQKGIHSIEIVRGTVISDYIYPFKGNEKAMGLDLMSIPAEREAILRAINTRKTVLAGPVELIQGGEAFISRSPIFTLSGKTPQKAKYYGLLQSIITTDSVFREAGLYDKNSAFRFAIRGKDATGASGAVFFGDKMLFDNNPMLFDVTLFNGSWQIAAVPVGGWEALPHNLWIIRSGGGMLSLLTGFLAWLLVRNPIILKEKIGQAVNALREKEKEMQKLKDGIETTERRRLAKELHDSVGQSLLAMKLSLQMMKTDKSAENSMAIEELITDVSKTTDEIRHIVAELRIPYLESGDVINALRQLSAMIEQRSGTKIKIISDGSLNIPDYNIRYNIYRICQEALNNIVKHSGADKAEISLAVSDGEMLLGIRDNGRGFAVDTAREMQRGSGLSTMAERAESISGNFNIKSTPGEGTAIQITAPLL